MFILYTEKKQSLYYNRRRARDLFYSCRGHIYGTRVHVRSLDRACPQGRPGGAMMHIEQFFLEGLGHQSYFVTDSKSGFAAVVDPRRDVDIYLRTADRASTRITHILETHIHNDYVTGARELAARTGASIVGSSAAHLAYEYLAVNDNDRFHVGELGFQALATPGHTPEHISYAFSLPNNGTPHAVFSGGSMLV